MGTHLKVWLVGLALVSAALAIIALATQPARAAGPWYVAPGGSDSNDCLSYGPTHAAPPSTAR